MIFNTDNSKIKYMQLKKILIEQIKKGKFKPGEYLPSENKIQEEYGISRTPVRKALSELEQEGFVKKEMGKGTVVISTSKVTQKLPELASFAEDMKNKGLSSSYKLLEFKVESIPDELKKRLKKKEYKELKKQEFFLVKRLMLAQNETMAIHRAYLTSKKLENKFNEIKKKLSQGNSLYKMLDDYGIKPTYAKQFVSSSIANKFQSELLNIEKGSPLIQMDRLTYDMNNNLIEYVNGFYRADRYEYTIDMVAKN